MIAPLYNPTLRGCCHSPRGGMGFMGADSPLTPEAAMQQALQLYSGDHVNPAQSQDPTWLADAASYIQAGSIPVAPPFGPNCSGQPAPNVNLFQTASGLALSTATTATAVLSSSAIALIPAVAVPVIGWVIAGVGAIFSLIDAIFKHHAQAEARDLQFGCSTLPAVNNAFSVVAQAVADGTMTTDQAATALEEVYSQFMAAGGAGGSISGPSGIPSSGKAINDSPWLNSNGELSIVILGMVLYWTAQYQAMGAAEEAAAAAAASSSTSGATIDPATGAVVAAPAASASWFTEQTVVPGIPNWAVLVAGGIGLKMVGAL